MSDPTYRERYRPQFHFSAPTGPMNDPNGLVYYQGQYHLFYQRTWGQTWGHAVSTDMLHWRHRPDALARDEQFGNVASGSAAVDRDNTSGLGSGAEKPLVAFYTGWNRQEQCLAYSNDAGLTWTKHPANPVLNHPHRDPRVFRHVASGRWIMVLYTEDGFTFFASRDLLHWDKLQSLQNGFFECPDFFELGVDGDPANTRWVLLSGCGHYLIGRFDGENFTPESDILPSDWGNPPFPMLRDIKHCRHQLCSFYAAQTWNDAPGGRRLQIAWMPSSYCVTQGMPFTGHLNFPCELSLRQTPQGLRLGRAPVREIEQLHTQSRRWQECALPAGTNLFADTAGDLLDIRLAVQAKPDTAFALTLHGRTVAYCAATQTLTVFGRAIPLAPVLGRITLQVLADRTSLEVFANDGLAVLSCSIRPPEPITTLTLSSPQDLQVTSAEVHHLRSVWPT